MDVPISNLYPFSRGWIMDDIQSQCNILANSLDVIQRDQSLTHHHITLVKEKRCCEILAFHTLSSW